jgi:hypothetical protein
MGRAGEVAGEEVTIKWREISPVEWLGLTKGGQPYTILLAKKGVITPKIRHGLEEWHLVSTNTKSEETAMALCEKDHRKRTQ